MWNEWSTVERCLAIGAPFVLAVLFVWLTRSGRR